MAAEAEPGHIDHSGRTTLLQPGDGCRKITEDLRRRGRVFVAAPLRQCAIGIIQIQIGSRSRKQGHRQGRDPLLRQTVGHTPHPAIHTKHLGQHDIDAIT